MREKAPSSKLSPKWEGLYVIIKKITDVVHRIKKEKGRKQVVVHFNCLKKCFSKEEENQDKTKCVETGSMKQEVSRIHQRLTLTEKATQAYFND